MSSKPKLNPNVLVVDDDANTLSVMTHLFEGAGAIVKTATDGKEALKANEATEFDMIVLDVRMPNLDGMAAATALRDRGFSGTIIMSTVCPSGLGRSESKAAGVNAYFDKTVLKVPLVQALLQQFCVEAA